MTNGRATQTIPFFALAGAALAMLGAAPASTPLRDAGAPAEAGSPASAPRLLVDAPGLRAADASVVDMLRTRPQVVRSRVAAFNTEALPRPSAGGTLRGASSATLNLFPDFTPTIDFDRVHPGAAGAVKSDSYVVSGPVRGVVAEGGRAIENAFAVVSVHNGAVVADIYAPGVGVWQVKTAGAGTDVPAVVAELDRSRLSPCGTSDDFLVGNPELRHLNPERDEAGARSDDPSGLGPLIDVMVVYTASSQVSAGGQAPLEAAVGGWFATTNIAYESTGVLQRIRLVDLRQTNYSEGSAGTDLGRLRSSGDGFMDEVHTIRNQTGADIVHLISNSEGVCGLAYLMLNVNTGFASSAFGLTIYNCGGLTFAHELGHNMGCSHDRDNASAGAYCYSFGHRTSGNVYRTIMAYAPGSEIPFFSSPLHSFQGNVLGVDGTGCPADGADNSRTLNNTGPTVAQFRSQVIADPAPGVAVLLSPPANGVAPSRAPVFQWQPSPNALQYTIEVAADAGFNQILWSRKDYNNTIVSMPAGILDFGGQYFWRITALSLIQRTTTPASPFRVRALQDLNSDGAVGAADLGILLGSWGICPAPPNACNADLNGDGMVNAADLAGMLGAWGN